MRRAAQWGAALFSFWLVWTNPCDADLLYIRFYAIRSGNPDTLRSEPYRLVIADDMGVPQVRGRPCRPDSARYTLPRGFYPHIWATATDTAGNESGEGVHVQWTVVVP